MGRHVPRLPAHRYGCGIRPNLRPWLSSSSHLAWEFPRRLRNDDDELGYRILSDLPGSGTLRRLGSGFLFVPSVAIVATHFTTKRAFATGITVAGGSVGRQRPNILPEEIRCYAT